MRDFKKPDKGKRLCEILRAAADPDGKLREENPLYRFKRTKTALGSTGRYVYEKPVQKVFDLLHDKNGYGVYDDYDATAQDMRDKAHAGPGWIAGADQRTLSRFVYFFNRQADLDQKFTAQKIADGTLLAVLERAMALGRNAPLTKSVPAPKITGVKKRGAENRTP